MLYRLCWCTDGMAASSPVPERLIALEQKLQRDIFLFTYRTGIFAHRYPPLEVLEEQLSVPRPVCSSGSRGAQHGGTSGATVSKSPC